MDNEKQLLKQFHFTIGEQYEHYEFDLTSIKDIEINGITYDRYLYRYKEKLTLFGIVTDKIILFFNAEILCAVYFIIKVDCYNYIINKVNTYLSDNKKMIFTHSNDKISTKMSNSIYIEIKKMDSTLVQLKSANFHYKTEKKG